MRTIAGEDYLSVTSMSIHFGATGSKATWRQERVVASGGRLVRIASNARNSLAERTAIALESADYRSIRRRDADEQKPREFKKNSDSKTVLTLSNDSRIFPPQRSRG